MQVHSQVEKQTLEVETVTQVGHEYLLATIFVLGCLDFFASSSLPSSKNCLAALGLS